ncbi:hypothetical protein AB6A40_002358 [Gnathostoma spinigerum]|uniref:Methanethiol oxidase n=1 Tax=Gnathostoma spinigerum TaxID=75299 RepID=A0ABD6EE71_9BILA
MACCHQKTTCSRQCAHGPGYASPLDAFENGPREKILIVTCPNVDPTRNDMIATVDVDPNSDTYCKVIGRLRLPYTNDEVHHTGWNVCSSCYDNNKLSRSHMIAPCLNSSRIYIIDTADVKNLRIHKVIEPEILFSYDVSFPHTTHCLPDGNIMISTLGDMKGENKGSFILLNAQNFDPVGTWPRKDSRIPPFNYDYWYQPRQNVMISTEWGVPNNIKEGFAIEHLEKGLYGQSLHIWDWKNHVLQKTIKLEGPCGSVPLEVRFLHDPTSVHAFVGTAVGSSIYHIYKDSVSNEFEVEKSLSIPPVDVSNWFLDQIPALITDILISMDDKYLYLSCWLHGEIRQYDISDPFNAKLVGQVFLGGVLNSEPHIVLKGGEKNERKPVELCINGEKIDGGPQMLQLSLDGKRLYVSTSLYRSWDRQFYPSMMKNGAKLLRIDVDTVDGGLNLNKEFLVDFGRLPDGPYLAHEMRYPGGDCTSDIWI